MLNGNVWQNFGAHANEAMRLNGGGMNVCGVSNGDAISNDNVMKFGGNEAMILNVGVCSNKDSTSQISIFVKLVNLKAIWVQVPDFICIVVVVVVVVVIKVLCIFTRIGSENGSIPNGGSGSDPNRSNERRVGCDKGYLWRYDGCSSL